MPHNTREDAVDNRTGDDIIDDAPSPTSGAFFLSASGLFLCAALIAILAMGWLMNQRIQELEAKLAQQPAIAVVDLVQVASRYPDGASAEEIDRLMVRTNRMILGLQEEGYLVLSAGSVMAAPESVYLSPELFVADEAAVTP